MQHGSRTLRQRSTWGLVWSISEAQRGRSTRGFLLLNLPRLSAGKKKVGTSRALSFPRTQSRKVEVRNKVHLVLVNTELQGKQLLDIAPPVARSARQWPQLSAFMSGLKGEGLLTTTNIGSVYCVIKKRHIQSNEKIARYVRAEVTCSF